MAKVKNKEEHEKDKKEKIKSSPHKSDKAFTDDQKTVRNSFVGGEEWTVSVDGVVVVKDGQPVDDGSD